MTYTITKYHGKYNVVRHTSTYKYIVVHYTAGTGSARNNCIYFSNGNRNASAHYFIDDVSIYEYADPSKYATWHCGDGNGRYGITNQNSIGIEVVNTGSAFSQEEIKRLTWLVQKLMKQYGIAADHVVRHYDASRKQCPLYYVKNPGEWTKLHAQITGGKVIDELPNETPGLKTKIDVDGYWGPATTRALQTLLGTPVDGIVSGQDSYSFKKTNRGGLSTASWKMGTGGSLMIRALQKKIGTTVDGLWGPNTCKALQKYLGTYVDGYVDGPSNMVKALQRKINTGKF